MLNIRKQFFARFILFVLLLLVPAAAGEIYVRSLPNAAKSKHEFLQKNSRNVDVLVLGSSHAYYGIAPELLGSHAFSAAMVSQTLRYDDWLLHHYVFDSLQCVVQTLSDFSLYEELEGGREWYLANRYRLYMDCDLHAPWSVYAWEITAFPVFCEKLRTLWTPLRMKWSACGQGLEYVLENRSGDWMEKAAQRVATNHYTDFSHAPENVEHLQHMADFCRERGAAFLLVKTPLHAAYRKCQDARQIANTERHLQSFLKKNPSARLLDFSADESFVDSDFYDSDHLSLQGSHKLSRKIREAMGR